MAAVLACGDRAALFGLSTGQHFGLMPFSAGAIHVALPRLVRRSPSGILVHRPRGLEPIDLTKRLGIPTTTATRALFDLAPSLTANALRTPSTRPSTSTCSIAPGSTRSSPAPPDRAASAPSAPSSLRHLSHSAKPAPTSNV